MQKQTGWVSTGRVSRWLLMAIAVACWCGIVVDEARSSFPQLSLILPRGVQRGGDRELVFRGVRLKDAAELLFYSSDPAAAFVVRGIQTVDDNSFKATVFVPEDCPLGEHLVQVRCTSGISEFRSFFVGALPVIDEKEPNGSLAEAQAVPLNSTIQGVVTGEDVDYFAIPLAKGQRLSVDVEALRLGTFLFDPAVAILDEKRFELATVDDVPIAFQDCVVSMLAPADGTYYVQMRETSYGGNDNCRYRLHVGTFPRPTAVYPAGGKAGEKVAAQFLGDAAGPLPYEVAVPAAGSLLKLFATDAQGIGPTSIPFRISPQGNLLESEPNNDIATANNSADPSSSFNGIISTDGDADCFRFDAKKGETFDIEWHCRRQRRFPRARLLPTIPSAGGWTLRGPCRRSSWPRPSRFRIPHRTPACDARTDAIDSPHRPLFADAADGDGAPRQPLRRAHQCHADQLRRRSGARSGEVAGRSHYALPAYAYRLVPDAGRIRGRSRCADRWRAVRS